jgi:acetyl-CoA synthetase
MIVNSQYNIGHICTRQQCDKGLSDNIAFRWIPSSGEALDYSFADLENRSSQFANVLAKLGFAPGEILFTFLPKCPEQFFSFLGTLKKQVVCGTLFSNFGDEALLDRLGDSRAKGLSPKSFLKSLVVSANNCRTSSTSLSPTSIDTNLPTFLAIQF